MPYVCCEEDTWAWTGGKRHQPGVHKQLTVSRTQLIRKIKYWIVYKLTGRIIMGLCSSILRLFSHLLVPGYKLKPILINTLAGMRRKLYPL